MSETTNSQIHRELVAIRELVVTQLKLFRVLHSSEIEKAKTKILEEPARRKVYELCDDSKNVTQLAQAAYPDKTPKQALAAASYHLNLLEEYGLVGYRVEGGQRHYFKTRG